MQGFCENYQQIPEETLKNDYQNLPDDQKQVLEIHGQTKPRMFEDTLGQVKSVSS
jgi:hypothetical protein